MSNEPVENYRYRRKESPTWWTSSTSAASTYFKELQTSKSCRALGTSVSNYLLPTYIVRIDLSILNASLSPLLVLRNQDTGRRELSGRRVVQSVDHAYQSKKRQHGNHRHRLETSEANQNSKTTKHSDA
jgi:hypothetical protein